MCVDLRNRHRVSTVTPGDLQAFSRAKGKYPPLAVAWYLFLVHIQCTVVLESGLSSRRFSEPIASKRATAVRLRARQGLSGAAARRASSILDPCPILRPGGLRCRSAGTT